MTATYSTLISPRGFLCLVLGFMVPVLSDKLLQDIKLLFRDIVWEGLGG